MNDYNPLQKTRFKVLSYNIYIGHKSNTSAKKKKEINKDRHKVDTKNDNKYKDKEKEREKEREKDKKKHKKHKYNSVL